MYNYDEYNFAIGIRIEKEAVALEPNLLPMMMLMMMMAMTKSTARTTTGVD